MNSVKLPPRLHLEIPLYYFSKLSFLNQLHPILTDISQNLMIADLLGTFPFVSQETQQSTSKSPVSFSLG